MGFGLVFVTRAPCVGGKGRCVNPNRKLKGPSPTALLLVKRDWVWDIAPGSKASKGLGPGTRPQFLNGPNVLSLGAGPEPKGPKGPGPVTWTQGPKI